MDCSNIDINTFSLLASILKYCNNLAELVWDGPATGLLNAVTQLRHSIVSLQGLKSACFSGYPNDISDVDRFSLYVVRAIARLLREMRSPSTALTSRVNITSIIPSTSAHGASAAALHQRSSPLKLARGGVSLYDLRSPGTLLCRALAGCIRAHRVTAWVLKCARTAQRLLPCRSIPCSTLRYMLGRALRFRKSRTLHLSICPHTPITINFRYMSLQYHIPSEATCCRCRLVRVPIALAARRYRAALNLF